VVPVVDRGAGLAAPTTTSRIPPSPTPPTAYDHSRAGYAEPPTPATGHQQHAVLPPSPIDGTLSTSSLSTGSLSADTSSADTFSAGTVRRSGSRRIALLVTVGLFAALLGGAAAYVALDNQRSGGGAAATQSAQTSLPSSQGSQVSTPSQSPSSQESSLQGSTSQGSSALPSTGDSSADSGSTDSANTGDVTDTPPPSGYSWADDPGGFRFLLPDGGWARSTEQGQIDYSPDSKTHLLRFSVINGQTDTPLQHAETMEQAVAASPNYARLKLVENTYRGEQGAVWEFTFDSATGPRHAIEQLYLVNGVEYAIYLSYPEADWKTGEQRFYAVRNSFTPVTG